MLIHGFWSTPTTWNPFLRSARQDEELADVAFHTFGYESPKLGRRLSTVRIPDYNDIAQSIEPYLAAHVRTDASIVFITHSQGGLILQRFFAWMLSEGRGYELARAKLAALLACPNEGSEFMGSIRAVLGFGRHPQARDLATLSSDAAEARRIVMRQIVNATSTNERQCRIPFHVYAGRSDKIVTRTSAYASFPKAVVLPGDHFSIINTETAGNITYPTIKRLLLGVKGTSIDGLGGKKPQAITTKATSSALQPFTNIICNFCGKTNKEVSLLVQNDKIHICDECIDLSGEILHEKGEETRASAVARVCEITVRLTSVEMPPQIRLEYQEDLDEQAAKVRSTRRPRPRDEVAGAELIRVVGAGNFGTVWQASRDDQPCAVKIFDSDKVTLGLMLWRFQRGIRAMQHLTELLHSNPRSICEIWEVSPDRLAFSMPYLPGGDLSTLKRLGWSPKKKRNAFIRIANAVDFAHRNGVVHRDIKPANIVLDSQHEPVLTDFDIADLTFASTQSVSAASLGTPSFAAPEQLEGQLQAAPTADIYSLGKVLNFLVTEEAPPLGSTSSVFDEDDSYLIAKLPTPTLRRLVGRCIKFNPKNRFQSVEELLEDLPESFEA
ncbi:MAG TPA: alpha/beta fold hydrolase [Trebonia sp.]|nr:alpha/beta fold hydrolase [Trebonia sp.]